MWRTDATIPDLNEDEFTDPLEPDLDENDDSAHEYEDDEEPGPTEPPEYIE